MGASPIQFSPNVGLATVITTCQPTEGSAHGTSGCKAGHIGGPWRREFSVEALRAGPGDEKVQCGAVAPRACVMCVRAHLCVAMSWLWLCVRLGYPGRLHVYK